MTFKEVEQAIVAQTLKSDEFRKEFMADPRGSIEKYSGQTLPADVSVHAHENNDKELHFVIPAKPDELTDEDLEKVAGGEFVVGAGIIAITCAVTTAAASVANDQTRSRAGW
jgi:hypothetical protein